MKVTIRAYDKKRYHQDILIFDDEQTRMICKGIEDSIDVLKIDPEEFPEVDYFTIVVDRYK
jgi:hypothetical protein